MRENTFHRRTTSGRNVTSGLPTVSCIICRCYVWKWKSSLSCNSALLNFVSRLYSRRVVASSCSFCWLLLTRTISFACRRISLICRMCCCLPAGSRVSSRANEHFSSLRLFCLPKTGGDFRFHFFSVHSSPLLCQLNNNATSTTTGSAQLCFWLQHRNFPPQHCRWRANEPNEDQK